jgi:hypothetical protein
MYHITMKMKCLSVRNPLSYLICAGIKDVENRTWKTDYRGRIYIHSSGKFAYDLLPENIFPNILITELEKIEYKDDLVIMPKKCSYRKLLNKIIDFVIEGNKSEKPFYKNNSIIGYVELVDIIKNSDSVFAIPGQYHWILKKPVLFDKPILNIKGKLNFFNVEVKDV